MFFQNSSSNVSRSCFPGVLILQEYSFCRSTYLPGAPISQNKITNKNTNLPRVFICLTYPSPGVPISQNKQEYISPKTTHLLGVLISQKYLSPKNTHLRSTHLPRVLISQEYLWVRRTHLLEVSTHLSGVPMSKYPSPSSHIPVSISLEYPSPRSIHLPVSIS